MIGRKRAGAALAALWLLSGCTTLREIPRSDYAAEPERKNVRIWTSEGLEYEFDYVKVRGDSVVGYKRRDVEGSFDEYATLAVALPDVARMSARGVDWYRTGLVGGGLLAAVVAAGLATNNDPEPSSNPGPGGGGRVP